MACLHHCSGCDNRYGVHQSLEVVVLDQHSRVVAFPVYAFEVQVEVLLKLRRVQERNGVGVARGAEQSQSPGQRLVVRIGLGQSLGVRGRKRSRLELLRNAFALCIARDGQREEVAKRIVPLMGALVQRGVLGHADLR